MTDDEIIEQLPELLMKMHDKMHPQGEAWQRRLTKIAAIWIEGRQDKETR